MIILQGIITDIDGEEIFSEVTIQFANCKKVIYRNQIDKGDYHKEIRNIKENLAWASETGAAYRTENAQRKQIYTGRYL